jgi:hypothetical protein
MNWVIAQAERPSTNFWAIERTSGPIFSQPLFWWVLGAMVGTIVFLFFISRVPSNFRKPISVFVTFVAGFFFVLEWAWPRQRTTVGETAQPFFGLDLREVIPIISPIAQILTGMLLALGVLSIFRVHFGRVFKMQKDWFFSAVLLLSLFVMVGLGLINWRGDRRVLEEQAEIDLAARKAPGGVMPVSDRYANLAKLGVDDAADSQFEAKFAVSQRDFGQKKIDRATYNSQISQARSDADKFRSDEGAKVDQAAAGTLAADQMPAIVDYVKAGVGVEKERSGPVQGFNLLFSRGLLAMDAAMFSLIGFFILSAAYRAFRIRSIEASILMATALVVLLMFVPIALMLTNGLDPGSFAGNFRIDSIGLWLLSTINVPAIRAIDLGLGLGLLAMALRIMLGLERGVAAD